MISEDIEEFRHASGKFPGAIDFIMWPVAFKCGSGNLSILVSSTVEIRFL